MSKHKAISRTGLDDLSQPSEQSWPLVDPALSSPIIFIGAGTIIRDAHIPAYKLAGYEMRGIYDPNLENASARSKEIGSIKVFESLSEAISFGHKQKAIYDIAIPPAEILKTLEVIPEGSAVLIQKPLGKNLADAKKIVALCKKKNLIAGINLQLPFSPQITTAFRALEMGLIGRCLEAKITINLLTAWSTWPFVLKEPRIEYLLHSIHYHSVFAFYFGIPQALESSYRGDPSLAELAEKDICTETTLYYSKDDQCKFDCQISCNHLADSSQEDWISELSLVGESGSIRAGIKDNFGYSDSGNPTQYPDTFEINGEVIPLIGSRFPYAFIPPMSFVQQGLASLKSSGKLDQPLPNDIEFGLNVMRMVESCYLSQGQRISLVK